MLENHVTPVKLPIHIFHTLTGINTTSWTKKYQYSNMRYQPRKVPVAYFSKSSKKNFGFSLFFSAYSEKSYRTIFSADGSYHKIKKLALPYLADADKAENLTSKVCTDFSTGADMLRDRGERGTEEPDVD